MRTLFIIGTFLIALGCPSAAADELQDNGQAMAEVIRGIVLQETAVRPPAAAPNQNAAGNNPEAGHASLPSTVTTAELVRNLNTMLKNVEMNRAELEKDDIIFLLRNFVHHAEKTAGLKPAPAAKPVITAAAPKPPAPPVQPAARKKAAPLANLPMAAVTSSIETGSGNVPLKPLVEVMLPDSREFTNENAVLEMDEVGLEQLVENIRDRVGVNVVMDGRAIDRGIRNGTVRPTITLKVDDMTLKNALNWICRLSGLTWTLKDEAIFITTPERVSRSEFTMKVYDIRDAIVPVPDFPAPPVAFGKTGEALMYD